MSTRLQGIASYKLLDVIFECEHSTVYHATELDAGGINQPIMLEVFHRSALADTVATTAFMARNKQAKGLRSPKIVATVACGDADGQPWVVRELVDGLPLQALFPAKGRLRLPPEVAATILDDILSGLSDAALATPSLVHGQLSAADVWVTVDGQAKLAGFGTEGVAATDLPALVGIAQQLSPNWPAEMDRWLDNVQQDRDGHATPSQVRAAMPMSVAPDARKQLARRVKRAQAKRRKAHDEGSETERQSHVTSSPPNPHRDKPAKAKKVL